MSEIAEIQEKIKNNLLLTEENKKRLLAVLDRASEEDLKEINELLDHEGDAIMFMLDRLSKKKMQDEDAEEYMKATDQVLKNAEKTVAHKEEETEHEEEEKEAEKLLEEM